MQRAARRHNFGSGFLVNSCAFRNHARKAPDLTLNVSDESQVLHLNSKECMKTVGKALRKKEWA